MHNESQATRTEEPTESKKSKIKKLAAKAGVATLYVGAAGVTGASLFYGVRTQKLQYEVAKLALEAAKKA